MRLSRKGTYALRVLRRLADAGHGAHLSAAALAREEGFSTKFLEQILTTLRKRGIIASRRGKDGGYTLRKDPADITLGEIVRAVDGPLAPLPCASRTAPVPCEEPECPFDYETCWLRAVMLEVRDGISAIMDTRTLADVQASARRAQPRG